MNSREVSIIVRILPTGEDYDLDCNKNTTSIEIIETLIQYSDLQQIKYKLAPKGTNRVLHNNESIHEAQIQNGDILLMYPILNQNDIGQVYFSIPGIYTIGEKSRAWVQVTKGITKDINEEFEIENVTVELIEISEIMRCKLVESSIRNHINIISMNADDQFFGSTGEINWRFDIIPLKVGNSAIILKISIIKHFKNIGEKQKDIFFFDKEIIVKRKESALPEHYSFTKKKLDDVSEVYSWTIEKRKEILYHIQRSEIGIALSKLANITQGIDTSIFNSIVLLQAKLNDVKNKFNIGLIEPKDWLLINTRVTYAALELINNLDESPETINIEKINNRLQL